MSQKTLFLDTNSFIHYPFPKDIDWLVIYQAKHIVIVVTPIVIRELNDIKDGINHPKKTRERAGRVLKMIDELFESELKVEIRPHVEVCSEYKEATPEFFVQHNLNLHNKDDHHLVSVLLYVQEHPTDEVSFVTHDVGAKLKAKHLGITAVKLPSASRLPDDIDNRDKRIRELEEENRTLKNRIPKLQLCFVDGSIKDTFSLSPFVREPDYVHSYIQEIILNHPLAKYDADKYSTLNPSFPGFALLRELQPTQTQIRDYNVRLKNFYQQQELFIRSLLEHEEEQSRTITLSIQVQNTGTCPAEDIDIILRFKGAFEVRSSQNLPVSPEEPKLPERPGIADRFHSHNNLFPSTLSQIGDGPTLSQRLIANMEPAPNVSRIGLVKKQDGFEARFHVQKLKQTKHEEFEPIHVTFASFENASTFQIEYTINAQELPDNVSGKLVIIVEKSDATSTTVT